MIALLAIGIGIVQLIGARRSAASALGSSIFFGFLLVVAALGVLMLLGRRQTRREPQARAARPAR